MKKRNKNNYNNNNKTKFKDIIQCQRVITAEPNLIIKCVNIKWFKQNIVWKNVSDFWELFKNPKKYLKIPRTVREFQ